MRAKHCAAVLAELLAWGHLRVANGTEGYSRLHVIIILRLFRTFGASFAFSSALQNILTNFSILL